MRYGFIGTGTITRAMVVGLSEGVSSAPPIALSPRNAGVAADLAARFANVAVEPTNAGVVERSDAVVLAVRPDDASTALAGLPYQSRQTIISVMAGLSIEDVSRLVAPATRVVRAIPLPEVARRSGTTPVFPADECTAALFARLGQVLVPPTEAALDAYSAVTALIGAHLDYLDAVSRWLGDQGVPAPDARRYVAAIFRELSLGLDVETAYAKLADDFSTPGGINAQVRAALHSAGLGPMMHQALDEVLARIATS
jgi:pyrroline-5-carboxylate reductase